MRIAFYIEDLGYTNKHLEKPEKGNPGIGGTWYEFALVASSISRYENGKYDICIYHHNTNFYPEFCKTKRICDYDDIFTQCERDCIDVLIYKTDKSDEWYSCINIHNVKCIAWAHTFLGYKERIQIERSQNVVRVICVGREHYDNYIDEDFIKKTSYIYNMVCKTNELYRTNNYTHNVTYIGSIIPAKSFHKLAKAWKWIIRAVPDASLNVIGSGLLYNQDVKLGKYCIAENKYEQKFMKYLTDKEGNILNSVRFCGILGEEKKEYILNSSVGVVNPTTKSETFCISAVEFEQYGVPVCSGRKNGLLDTVIHKKTGLLSLTTYELSKNIIKLLTDDKLNDEYGNNARIYSENFTPERLTEEWIKCIEDVYRGKEAKYISPKENLLYNGKLLRLVVRFIRFDLGFKAFPSCAKLIYISKNIIKKIIQR